MIEITKEGGVWIATFSGGQLGYHAHLKFLLKDLMSLADSIESEVEEED